MGRMMIALVAALICALPLRAAHDIPNDVQVQAFVKPDGQQINCSCACRYLPCARWIFRAVALASWISRALTH